MGPAAMSEINSIANFRDYGGFATGDGYRVKEGRLFRSGLLCDLDEKGQQRLADLDVRVICDMRSQEECRVNPAPEFKHAPRYLNLPIEPGKRLAELPLGTPQVTPEQRAERLQVIYVELAEDHAHVYAKYFQELLALEAGASLLHCTAGKDRTGFGAAIVLRSLGVSEDEVMGDYLRTNETLDFGRFIAPRLKAYYKLDFTPEFAKEVAQARTNFLEAAFKAIDDRWGSFLAYLERGLGMTEARVVRLRDLYLA